jgi:hypothetical protein
MSRAKLQLLPSHVLLFTKLLLLRRSFAVTVAQIADA